MKKNEIKRMTNEIKKLKREVAIKGKEIRSLERQLEIQKECDIFKRNKEIADFIVSWCEKNGLNSYIEVLNATTYVTIDLENIYKRKEPSYKCHVELHIREDFIYISTISLNIKFWESLKMRVHIKENYMNNWEYCTNSITKKLSKILQWHESRKLHPMYNKYINSGN